MPGIHFSKYTVYATMYVHLVINVFGLAFSHPDGYSQIMSKLGECSLMTDCNTFKLINYSIIALVY